MSQLNTHRLHGEQRPFLSLFEPVGDDQQNTLFEPEPISVPLSPESRIHRITNPVVPAATPSGGAMWEQHCQEAQAKYQPKLVSEAERPDYVRQTSVPQFYADCLPGARWEPLGTKGRTKASAEKDRQALRRWCDFTRPQKWPISEPWPGPSLQMIEASNGDLIDEWVTRMQTEPSKSGKPFAPASILSSWSHIRTILNHAVEVQAIRRFPAPSDLPEDDETPRYYTEAELGSLWRFLDKHPLLKVAVVISCCCGPRAEDLFCLPKDCVWLDDRNRPHLKFEARKTGKKHLCPLHPIAMKAITFAQRQATARTLFPEANQYLFPGLTNPTVKEPEDSPAAKRRAAKQRVIWDAAGLEDVERPWQVGRSTCATRLAAIDREAGKFMIGTGSKDVFTRSYAAPPESVWSAVMQLQPPTCFINEFGVS